MQSEIFPTSNLKLVFASLGQAGMSKFGVQQPLEGISTPSKSMPPIFEKSPEVEVEVEEELEEGKFLDIAS